MLTNIRLGDDIDPTAQNPNYDPAVADEMITNRVMKMMKNIDTDSEIDDDVESFLKAAEKKSTQKSITQSNVNSDEFPNEEEENEIFNRLLNV